MVKKLKYLLLFIPFLFTLNVNAVQFGTGGYSCVYFENGGNYCSPVVSFSYDNNSYYGANYSYDPDLLDITGETVLDFNNQSFCSNQSTGGTLTFRLYHNYNFEENPIDYIKYRLNSNIINYCSTIYNRNGRYSDITCNFSNSFTNSTLSLIYKFNDLGISFPFTAGASNVSISENCGFSTSDVVNNQNQNTNSIINNQNQNTTTITQNQDDNTQDIINNQNQNTQDIINNQNQSTQDIIDSNKVCTNSFNITSFSSGLIGTNGSTASNNVWKYSDKITINNNSLNITYTRGVNNYVQMNLVYYDNNNNFVERVNLDSYSNNQNITIPNNIKFIILQYNSTNNPTNFYINGGVCVSGNQVLNDSLTSTASPDVSSDISDMSSSVSSLTPISDLILMPLTLINAYINGINSSCSPVNLGNLYGTDLIIPCINIQNYLGSNLWHIIDIFVCIFMCYEIAMLFISAFDGLTSLRDDFVGLYQPRHANNEYKARHGGDN